MICTCSYLVSEFLTHRKHLLTFDPPLLLSSNMGIGDNTLWSAKMLHIFLWGRQRHSAVAQHPRPIGVQAGKLTIKGKWQAVSLNYIFTKAKQDCHKWIWQFILNTKWTYIKAVTKLAISLDQAFGLNNCICLPKSSPLGVKCLKAALLFINWKCFSL